MPLSRVHYCNSGVVYKSWCAGTKVKNWNLAGKLRSGIWQENILCNEPQIHALFEFFINNNIIHNINAADNILYVEKYSC